MRADATGSGHIGSPLEVGVGANDNVAANRAGRVAHEILQGTDHETLTVRLDVTPDSVNNLRVKV